MNILSKLVSLAYQAGGSFKSVDDRQNMAKKFAVYLKDENIQIAEVWHLKSKYIESFVEHRKQKGIGKRTLQNEMAAIRVILRRAGRHDLAVSERLSNKALGINNASRNGTHKAIPDDLFQSVCDKLREIYPDIFACALLQRLIGLRNEEAVQSCKSLASWLKELERGDSVRVIYGTKGGRPRNVKIFRRDETISAIEFALERVKENGGKLVNMPNLKAAMEHHRYVLRTAGLKGEFSPHSMRYAFACDQVDFYVREDFSLVDALAQTSMDLGHGDGRGRYVKQVYMNR